ncbi:hypothetical protein [Luteimonas aquatica]|uniref:hypothetical protein n=1 Tax=Luteimonas aquatica TaxID=450364 RepID=UPI001F560F00|nr:hypothetical protein [Luteimonas aquatica]
MAALAACHRDGGEASPVAGLDDPRVAQGQSADEILLQTPMAGYLDEHFRTVAGGPEVLGAARIGPDIVKVYLTRPVQPAESLAHPYVAYAADCRTRRMRVAGAGDTFDAVSRGMGAQAAVTPWPAHAGQAAVLETVCANRMRCEFLAKDNPCRREMLRRLERANAAAAASMQPPEPEHGEPPARRE